VQTVCRARALLGTRVEISVLADAPESRLHAAIDAAFAEIERIHQLMSCQEAHSELSRLNRAAHREAVPVDGHTFAVLTRALQFAQLSDGAFDPCVGGTLERLGLLPPPDDPTPPGARWSDIALLDGQRVRFARALRLDLSGIAKGYAVDLAVECLQRRGIESVMVNAGGDLRVAGPNSFQIGVRDPRSPARIAHALHLRHSALATSAAYPGSAATLLDLRSDRPCRGCGSISVRAAQCMNADALTKVVLFAPPPLAEAMLANFDAVAFAMA
jgi:thiamine biosynthesis lipoprotein